MFKPLIAGNWKLNKTIDEALELVEDLKMLLPQQTFELLEVALAPSFVALSEVSKTIKNSQISIAAQNLFWEPFGAFTGQISPIMLKAVGCKYVIVGHSETRGRFGTPKDYPKEVLNYFAESDVTVNLKLKAAFNHSLHPILCVGETLEERKAKRTDEVVEQQLTIALQGVSAEQAKNLTIAYEPVWAIGTGEYCEPKEANRVMCNLKNIIAAKYSQEVRLLYGGSVTADNISGFMQQPYIDGALVGGASLTADSFYKIIMNAAEALKHK